MPKFIVTVIHSGQTGRITVDAPSGDDARERAVFDGYKVTDVALAMPEQLPPSKAQSSAATDKPSLRNQLIAASTGLPAILLMSLGSLGSLSGLILGAIFLAITYFAICRPNGWATIWKSYRRVCGWFGVFFFISLIGLAVMLFSPDPHSLPHDVGALLMGLGHVPAILGILLNDCIPIFGIVDPLKEPIGIVIEVLAAGIMTATNFIKVGDES